MTDKTNTRFLTVPDISFRIDPDSPLIELEQNAGCGETTSITLHRVHLRLLLEETGMLTAPQQVDDMSRKLAGELCDILYDLANECGVSPGVDRIIVRLNAIVGLLPESLFQQGQDGESGAETAPAEQPVPADPPPFVLEPTP